jgi:OOP family OmpA-OmpF porin
VKEAAPEVVSITLMINFDSGKSYVRPRYYNEVKKVADFMKKYPNTKMEIQGHTDNVGKPAMNKRLSQRRADAVKNLLIKKYKVNKNRLKAVGYGEEKPLVPNDKVENRSRNRRVQAVLQTTVK